MNMNDVKAIKDFSQEGQRGLPRSYFLQIFHKEYKINGTDYDYWYWYLCKYIGPESGHHKYWLLGRADGKKAITENEAHFRALEKISNYEGFENIENLR